MDHSGWKKDNNMYDFVKLKDEEIIFLSEDSILKIDDSQKEITVIITNKRILLFGEDKFNYQESLKFGEGVNYLPRRVLLLESLISDIEFVEEDFDKYILESGNYFYLKDDKVKECFLTLSNRE